MGAWGITNFENDTAIDWLNNLPLLVKNEAIDNYLDTILEEKEFIDDEESFICLAIAEFALHYIGLSKIEILQENRFTVNFTITQLDKIVKVIHKILYFEEHSELRELWQETEDYDIWEKHQLSIASLLQNYIKNNLKKGETPPKRPPGSFSVFD
jgi:hypothetical protein